ncbi:MAG: SAM-dependent methyltransferase [Pseudomonadota bacterium]
MFESNTDTSRLPTPPAEALTHSATLVDQLRADIAQSGPLTFGAYVHEALYRPGLGYYASGTQKFGAQGDFITAPELGSVFAHCVARGIARVLRQLSSKSVVLELGAGSGEFALHCLTALQHLEALPQRYQILEVSPTLQTRQKERLESLPSELSSRVEWLDAPPSAPFEGVVFANEVIDALPMERFGINEHGDVVQARVELGEKPEALTLTAHAPTRAVAEGVLALQSRLRDRDEVWMPFYTHEFRPGLTGWLHTVTDHLTRGAALFVDYGTDELALYRGDRSRGTLLCHFQHRAHDDALLWPGLQDITSWVDFSALANAAHDLGLTIDGYTTQAHMLIDTGLDSVVSARFEQATRTEQSALAREVRQLTLPGDMGERFKALSMRRGLDNGVFSPHHTSLTHRL